MRHILRHTLLLGLLLIVPALSRADLIFTLDSPIQSLAPGGILTFTGSLTNLNGPTLFLTSDTFTLDGPGLTLDDTSFLLNAPPSLDSGEAFTGELFTVSADPTAPAQQTVGEFNILGGPSDTDQTLLATKEFAVNVTPEPGSLALLMAGLVTGASGCHRLRHKQGNRHSRST